MRILYFSDVYFPRVNGVSTSMRTFSRELRDLGHEVIIAAPAYPQAAGADDANVIRIPARQIPLDPEDRLMGQRDLTSLSRHPRLQEVDLVHIQTPFAAHYAGLRFARQRGLPCVATYHTFFEEYLFHYVPFAPRALMRSLARAFSRRQGNQVDALVVPSRAMRSALAAYGVQTPMTVLPTGIRLQELRGGDGVAFRRAHGIAPQRPLLVHIGRVAFEKNIDFLLRMLPRVRARHPGVMLLIAGEGPALPSLKQLARTLGVADCVKFIGYLDRATTLLDCYSAGDAFVFASRTETQGLVLLEAMALGVPVVAIAEMGTIDILEPRRGGLVAQPDEADFARAVATVLDSPALRDHLSTEGRQFAAQWDAASQAQQLAALYAQVAVTPAAGVRDSGAGIRDGIVQSGIHGQ